MKCVKHINILVFLFGLYVLTGCEKKSLNPVEYVNWVEDNANGLNVKKTIGAYIYQVQYKPHNYIVLKENKNKVPTRKELTEQKETIKDFQYYTLKIGLEHHNGDLLKYRLSNAEEYQNRVRYFSFDLQKDIKLVENGDTIDCLLFHFERTFGITPYKKVVLGFPMEKKLQNTNNVDRTLIYEDRIFGSGKVKLTIKGKDISAIPQLETE